MYSIGLTGGIASGKSAVAEALADLGAHVIVADEIAREQVRSGSPVLDRLVSEFGRSILRDDGGLDRRGLGRVVFGDSEKLERLNAITHPPLVRGIMERLEDLARGDPAGVVVLDAALLLDWDIADAFDLVVVVRASEDIRVARLVDAGLSESEARARIGAQLPDAAYESRADEIIDNDGSLEELRASVRALWERIDGARRRP